MDNLLEKMSQTTRDEPYFLGYILEAYSEAARIDEALLSHELGCRPEDLVRLRLCRAPAEATEDFRRDVESIARYFGIDAKVLARIVKQGRVARLLSQASATPTPGYLLAARERDEEDDP